MADAKPAVHFFQGLAGILTALTVLATVIFTLLGVFGVVDMGAFRNQGSALAYVVAIGAFALSPLVAVGIVAVGLFNAIGIIAIRCRVRARHHCDQRGRRERDHCDQRRWTGVGPPLRCRRGSAGHGHRGLLGPQGDAVRALAALAGQRRPHRLIRCPAGARHDG